MLPQKESLSLSNVKDVSMHVEDSHEDDAVVISDTGKRYFGTCTLLCILQQISRYMHVVLEHVCLFILLCIILFRFSPLGTGVNGNERYSTLSSDQSRGYEKTVD